MRDSIATPSTGHITVTPGFALPCNHVIHTNCSAWNTGIGEEVRFETDNIVTTFKNLLENGK